MAGLQDILISPLTHDLLEANGKMDCERGIDMRTGWQEIATEMGFDPNTRTPAREAYEDGYYAGKFGSKKQS
jgi:hypothetical protein